MKTFAMISALTAACVISATGLIAQEVPASSPLDTGQKTQLAQVQVANYNWSDVHLYLCERRLSLVRRGTPRANHLSLYDPLAPPPSRSRHPDGRGSHIARRPTYSSSTPHPRGRGKTAVTMPARGALHSATTSARSTRSECSTTAASPPWGRTMRANRSSARPASRTFPLTRPSGRSIAVRRAVVRTRTHFAQRNHRAGQLFLGKKRSVPHLHIEH
jgi:hypothetical protein